MKLLLPVVLVAAVMTSRAESLDQPYAAFGRLIVTQFVTAPFPHPSRAEGHKYQDRFFPVDKHYSDSTVAIFIPKGSIRTIKRLSFTKHRMTIPMSRIIRSTRKTTREYRNNTGN